MVNDLHDKDDGPKKDRNEENKKPQNKKMFTVFELDNEEYAIEIDMMNEIIKDVNISNVPGSSKNVLGATNLRGEIIPVIDLKKILGLEKTGEEVQNTIIIHIDEKKWAAPVDKIKDIVSPNTDQLVDPSKITNLDGRRLRWIIRLEKGRSVRVINAQKLLEEEVKDVDIESEQKE